MNIKSLTSQEKQKMMEFFSNYPVQSYKKNEIIVQPNSIYRDVYFIQKGVTRIFYYDSKGEEITHWFSMENDGVSILSSVFDASVSPYGFQALEDNTQIRALSINEFMAVKETSEDVSTIFEKMLMSSAIRVANRLIAIQTKSAKERYDNLLLEHPEIFQRANLSHIATYLGMTRQSLSRIRGMK